MIILAILIWAIMEAVVGFFFAVPVMFLWNWIMPLLGITTLTYMQSWGLFVLFSLLFKSNNSNKESK